VKMRACPIGEMDSEDTAKGGSLGGRGEGGN